MLNVTDHGVVADGETLNTTALQDLIDHTAEAGGGTLHFPPGRYLSGGLVLRSHLAIYLEAGAVLLGSGKLDDYYLFDPPPERFQEGARGVRALLSAVDAEDIHLHGQGTIDGQGGQFARYPDVRTGRPRNLWFARCRNLTVQGLHLRNSGFWMQHYLKCERLRLIDLDIWNHASCNNDGIDIDCSRDVMIRGCRVDSADDAICLKSGNDRPTENVIVRDCQTRSHCNHFKTGTESNGGFRNILVDGMVMTASTQRESHPGTGGADWRGACGIGLGAVDGGCLENITVRNVTMDGVRVPFFVRLGDRGRPIPGSEFEPSVGFARRIVLRDLEARHASAQGCYIAGLPDSPIREVTVADCRLEFAGGAPAELVHRELPLNRDAYPSMEAFGDLPAYAVYARDVHELRLAGLSLTTEAPDPRPAVTWADCRNVALDGITAS